MIEHFYPKPQVSGNIRRRLDYQCMKGMAAKHYLLAVSLERDSAPSSALTRFPL